MDNLEIPATKYTPEIHFDSTENFLLFKGESYPENTADFFGPVISWLSEYLQKVGTQEVRVDVELSYFNSSSSKVLLNIFDMFEEAAHGGKKITINWIYDEEDEDNQEFGEEFQEDLQSLTFNLVPKEG